jgi:tetratricopeptide (TPR) repeat protein
MNHLRALLLLALCGAIAWLGLESREFARETGNSAPPQDRGPSMPFRSGGGERVPLPGALAQKGAADAADPALPVDRRPYDWNNLAIELLGAGELARAVELLEDSVRARPDETVFVHNLAEALTRLARSERESEAWADRVLAIEHLGRAVQLAPERAELARLLERWETSTAAEKDLWRKKTEHFELSFDGTRDELMWGTGPLESELESSYGEFGELFGFFPVEEGRPRIRVVLMRREEFAAVTGIGDWAAGAFDGTVRVPVEDLSAEQEKLKRVLRHELVHAFIQESGGNRVPGWLNEGLAQWLEAPFDGERPADVRRSLARLLGAELFDLDRLSGSLAAWDSVQEIETAYAQSLAFVEYVRRMYGERVLIAMVGGCKLGERPRDVFSRALGGLQLEVVLEDFAQSLR